MPFILYYEISYCKHKTVFFPTMPPHVAHIDFVFSPPGYGRSVTDFWGWGAHKARLHWYNWWWYVWAWSAKRGLKPKFYRLPRPWSQLGSSSARENSHSRTGNRTQDFMVSSHKFWPPRHEAGHNCICQLLKQFWRWLTYMSRNTSLAIHYIPIL
jgi:hypothetical protein